VLFREISCPYYKVGMEHPEVCSLDQHLFSRILEVDAKKVRCILNGDTHCTYVIPLQFAEQEVDE